MLCNADICAVGHIFVLYHVYAYYYITVMIILLF